MKKISLILCALILLSFTLSAIGSTAARVDFALGANFTSGDIVSRVTANNYERAQPFCADL